MLNSGVNSSKLTRENTFSFDLEFVVLENIFFSNFFVDLFLSVQDWQGTRWENTHFFVNYTHVSSTASCEN